MTSLMFEAQVGNWTKIIAFNSLQPTAYFLSALSFSLKPISSDQTPDIQIELSPSISLSKILIIEKGDRTIGWRKGYRTICRDDFVIRIDKWLNKASVSSPPIWEDIADLIESWIGLLYEYERGVRLHAVGFNNLVIIGKSGFGKSFLAMRHWDELIADEVLFVHKKIIENRHTCVRGKDPGPWKTRHGERSLRAKDVQPSRLPQIVFGNSNFWSTFFGIGLPQHLEFSLSLKTLWLWIIIAVRRLGFILEQKLWRSPSLNRQLVQQLMKGASDLPKTSY